MVISIVVVGIVQGRDMHHKDTGESPPILLNSNGRNNHRLASRSSYVEMLFLD